MEPEESGPPQKKRRIAWWWILLVVVSTPATAYLFSIMGWIPLTPTYAVSVGLVFGLLFIIYEVIYSRMIGDQMRKLYEPEPDGELH
jgi:hypothetical protein